MADSDEDDRRLTSTIEQDVYDLRDGLTILLGCLEELRKQKLNTDARRSLDMAGQGVQRIRTAAERLASRASVGD